MNAVQWYAEIKHNSIAGWISFATALCRTGKSHDRDMQDMWPEHMTETCHSEPEKINLVYTLYIFLRFGISFEVWYWLVFSRYIFFRFGNDMDITRIWQTTKDMKKVFVWQAYYKHMTKKGELVNGVGIPYALVAGRWVAARYSRTPLRLPAQLLYEIRKSLQELLWKL